jgi:predicted dehydrogenase
MKMNVYIIGTGQMAIDYANVLNEINVNFKVIGRGKDSAFNFESKTKIKPFTGGIETYLINNIFPENSYIIIATGTEQLMPTLKLLINSGVHKILVEKPAAISIEELIENENFLKSANSSIYVAYNRRFYSSVSEAKRLIEEDGGLINMHFEFTEWAHKINSITKAPGVKENWFFANSTHVVDLAFFIAGKPIDWNTYSKSGEIKWHSLTNFSGAGITESGVLFSYLSCWESAGRWSIELLTKYRRIYLKPLENILIQLKGNIEINEYIFDNSFDIKFKPGLYEQTKSFLYDELNNLLTIDKHIQLSKDVYSKIIKKS